VEDSILNLKKLEISGFKSFLNRLEMDFTTGITAVLGPNGCGKTNIVDAIRWVLGEQKTRLLRNTKMENVIFNGTKLRKPLGMAEVSMTLNNVDHALPVDYGEITISRKLYRSGVSEYYLNGELARLKDIKGLLVDSGLGSHAYSIIEREMVDSVISEKDQDKRFLLEEAAGVMRYRIQREEALRKIKQTEGDLLRLSDIMAELDKELRSLRYQVGKARRFTRLKEKVGRMEAVLIKRSLYDLLEKSDSVRAEKAHHEGIKLADDNEITVREDRLQESKINAAELERRLQDLHEKRYDLSQSLQQREERIAILLERISSGRIRIEEDEEEIKRSITKIGSLGEDVAHYRNAVDNREVELASSKSRLAQEETELERVAGELDRIRGHFRDKKQTALEMVRESERRRGLREHLEARLQELDAKKQREENQRSLLETEKRTVGERLSHCARVIEQRRAGITELGRETDESFQKSERIMELLARCEALDSAASIELHRLNEKKEYLERIRHEHGNGKEQFADNSRIKGILADHVKVEKKYRKCLEACLSPVLQGLMAGSREDALNCVREIRSNGNGGGRVQFLYPSGNGAGTRRFFAHGKVLGTALDFLSGEKNVADYLRPQLANVAVVADVDAAIEVMREDADVRVATLDGVFFDGAGRIVVGDTEDIDMTLLEYDSKIDEIVDSTRTLGRRTTNLRHRKQRLSATKGVELEKLKGEQRRNEIERTKVMEKLGMVNVSLVESTQVIEEIRSKLASQTDPGDTGIADMPSDEELMDLERHAIQLEGEKDAVAENVGKRRLEVATVSGEITTAKEKLNNIEMLEGELKELIRTREDDAKRSREEIASAESEIETSKSEIAEHHGRVEAVEADIGAVKTDYDAIKEKIAGIETELKELKTQRDHKKENLERCNLELATIETRIAGLLEKAKDNFAQDLQPYVDDRELFQPSEWEKFNDEVLISLRTKLEAFGPVNMLALDEFEEKNERFEFLTRQKKDLDEAKESLVQAIRRINREARRRLNETFELVRANFKTTFSTLFDGGEADLLFVDSDDPLEANIKIVANPKGKRLHDISSLSGGERALVALSLLFAIYLVKPSPFCVFDEVDAPLDDANIGRFVNMLRSFTDRIQFIVITHNKKTMEAANHLYGVTMQELGVSRMVSVHIGDVDEFQDKNVSSQNPPVEEPTREPEEVPVQT
jgi:chromosome segregation protein